MNISPEVKSIVRVELVARRPKTYTEALHIVSRVLNTYSNPHTDLFDPRRNCAKFCKASVTAL